MVRTISAISLISAAIMIHTNNDVRATQFILLTIAALLAGIYNELRKRNDH